MKHAEVTLDTSITTGKALTLLASHQRYTRNSYCLLLNSLYWAKHRLVAIVKKTGVAQAWQQLLMLFVWKPCDLVNH